MRKRNILVAAILLASGAPSAASVNIAEMAQKAAAGAATSSEKVRAVVGWTHANMDWTATDYQKRSVEEIIERNGGNCNEQAVVVRALLDRVGVKTRRVREVNIQPANPGRAARAAERIKISGNAASVFGFQHNDHVWIEYWDEAAGEWVPADPTLNLIGYEAWLQARLGFGARPTHAILPSRDMLVPIGIFAETNDEGAVYEDRTERYLLIGFRQIAPEISRSPAWSWWSKGVKAIAPHVRQAFMGKYNLQRDNEAIDQLRQVYEALKAGSAKPV